ncbi:MAG TPA: hypothetical protein VH641_08930 [Streptosporangiaceae bacterium]|jgi:hypothetical protein
MTDNRANANFNIGSQQGNITNVAGDATFHGGQHYTAVPTGEIRQELVSLTRIISALDLDPAVRGSMKDLIADADQGLSRADQDPRAVARPIERLTRLLKDAGSLAIAGASLIGPLERIAAWLGESGQAIIHLIG